MIGIDDLAVAGILGVVKRNWKPLLLGGIGLMAALYIWHLRNEVDDLTRDLNTATVERDTYKESASTQADAVKARERTIDRLNAQAIAILNDWRDTRADAAEVAAKTKALEARHRAAMAELTEKSNAENADPVELAIDGLGRLCREQQGRTGAPAGGC